MKSWTVQTKEVWKLQMKSFGKIILKHCPIFKEKELQTAYGVAEPHELVIKVFDENLGEIGKLAEKILGIYGLADEKKKSNLIEEEVEEIKN